MTFFFSFRLFVCFISENQSFICLRAKIFQIFFSFPFLRFALAPLPLILNFFVSLNFSPRNLVKSVSGVGVGGKADSDKFLCFQTRFSLFSKSHLSSGNDISFSDVALRPPHRYFHSIRPAVRTTERKQKESDRRAGGYLVCPEGRKGVEEGVEEGAIRESYVQKPRQKIAGSNGNAESIEVNPNFSFSLF